ncbi:MAG: hypothetical protein COA38_12430 [Fluviicola sp.]|nr:MAG: hypothetical protein COA38_12430 [Fluviicola sp.]
MSGRFFSLRIKTATTKNRTAYLRLDRVVFQLILSTLFIVAFASSLKAAEDLPTDTSTSRLYIHDIKFEGANVHIDGNYQYLLETIVDFLQKNSETQVHIRGHVCCGAGKRISRRRARNVYRFLKRQGIAKDRMTHAGYSNSAPLIFPERTDDDERRNRRVDFVLSTN